MTINIKITQTDELSSPATLLTEVAEMMLEMKAAELNRPSNNIGGENCNVRIEVIN